MMELVIFLKKLLFAIYQISRCLVLVVGQKARWRWLRINGDWPNDVKRRKFWIAAVMEARIENIRVVFDNEVFSLLVSPQKMFFDEMLDGGSAKGTKYYLKCSDLYPLEVLEELFLRRTILSREYRLPDQDNLPVVVLAGWKNCVVEDGAHRLALLASRGARFATVGIAFWSRIPV